jgi:hypothetical protein
MPTRKDLTDLYFLDARHRLLDLAAFLDRLDRSPGSDDFRARALRDALPILLEDRPDRTRAILDLLSDHTPEPLPQAPFQGAHGAPPPAAAGSQEAGVGRQ